MWLDRKLVGLALAGLALVGGGIFWYRTAGQPQTQVEILSAQTESDVSNTIYVDISGAVNQPGVYQLPAGSRVEDALQAAEGLAETASTKWIESNLNRAMVLTDGVKLYIPQIQDTLVETGNEKISLNSASKSELESLSGIGPVTAEKIIAGRPYQSIEELVNKKIVGQKTFTTIKNAISVW